MKPSLLALLIKGITWCAIIIGGATFMGEVSLTADLKLEEPGLVGYWPLQGDCMDHSGHGNHGVSHGPPNGKGIIDVEKNWVEIPASSSLGLGKGDFTLCTWVQAASGISHVGGDILTMYDSRRRRGFNLSMSASAGGYSSHGDDHHIHFGIDDGMEPTWEDCGRPSLTSNYVSNSLTVFDGHLYAAITDAASPEDWCHVFRYNGAQEWIDCGRVGDRRTHGAGPMIVHKGSLYVATWTYDWTRVGIVEPLDDYCCVYRYEEDGKWVSCGQPWSCRRLFALASFRGDLYVTAEDGRCYVWDGHETWTQSTQFPNYAHPMGIHDGKLYAGVLNPAGVWSFNGATWTPLGNPQGSEDICNQVHAIEVFQNRLHVTTWPEGHVVRLEPDLQWTDCGRLGDAMEINALTVYNGKLYGGSIPRAELFRYEGDQKWTSIRTFLQPPNRSFSDPKEWARITSLTVFNGKLFASMGSCTSSHLDAPCDFRGRVFAMEAGRSVSLDRDIGLDWTLLTAVKRSDHLELYVNGIKVDELGSLAQEIDLSSDLPLRIGCGETACFQGRIRDLKIYNRALPAEMIQSFMSKAPSFPEVIQEKVK